jgi:hypothetical protein
LAWGRAVGEDDPDKMLPFYSNYAVLWGTLSPTARANRAALRDYFVTAFKVLPGLKVAFGDQLIRVYGNAAVNTGYYTFFYLKDGETKSLPARYSFTFKSREYWLIVDHLSSALCYAIAPEIVRQESRALNGCAVGHGLKREAVRTSGGSPRQNGLLIDLRVRDSRQCLFLAQSCQSGMSAHRLRLGVKRTQNARYEHLP